MEGREDGMKREVYARVWCVALHGCLARVQGSLQGPRSQPMHSEGTLAGASKQCTCINIH